jgi:hypothetical protein
MFNMFIFAKIGHSKFVGMHGDTSAENSFGQKVWSTFPIAQCRIASPLQWRQCCLLLNEIKIFFNFTSYFYPSPLGFYTRHWVNITIDRTVYLYRHNTRVNVNAYAIKK